MSSSATIRNDHEHSECVQQTSTGGNRGTRRGLSVNSSSPSVAETRGRGQTRPLPRAAVEAGTGRRQMRPHPRAAVEPGTGAKNATRTRQRRTRPSAAAEPGIRERHTPRRRPRSPPTASDGEPSTGEGTDQDDDRPSSSRRSRVFELDLTPEQRAIPDMGPSTGGNRGNRRGLSVNSSSPSVAETRGRGQMRPLPRAAVEVSTGRRQMRPHPRAAVEPGTGANYATRTRQRSTRPSAAAEPGLRERNMPRRRARSPPSASDGEPSTDEGTDQDDDRPSSPRRSRVFELDLTPEQRAIPDTGLLHNLGYHLSAYARAGRGPPTQNLNCRGAWHTAVDLYHGAHVQYKELFAAAGFEEFLKIEPVDVPVAYNLALTERWFPETNTLHLPSCEIGPTPMDWTMVTGLSFEGKRIKANREFRIERALELLGKPGATKDGKIHLEAIKPTKVEVRAIPQTDEAKEKMFRRLFLYVVGSCFFNNNRSVISHNLVECLERIDKVGSYDWGEITYATFLAGMRRKVTAEIGAFTAFWQFLPFWAFEYLDVNRPMHNQEDVYPRARRWICSKKYSENESPQFIGPRFIASRCQLDYVEESHVTWEPYLASRHYWTNDDVQIAIGRAKLRMRFQGIHTWEYYLGERCRRQLGFPCQVPNHPPRKMNGTEIGHQRTGISAVSLVEENQDYASWFATNSIGRIVDVNRFLGGPGIAGKVIDQWMAKHQPDLIPIEQSQYEKLKEDVNALEEDCARLREELSRAEGEES